MSDLAEALIVDEECEDGKPSSTVYPDSLGYQTIGVACCVDKKVPGAGLCPEAMAVQFEHDSTAARVTALKYPNYHDMNAVQQAVLISMSFQLGEKPLHWPDFMAALSAKDYVAAEKAGLDSKWARSDSPNRAKRQMAMLRSGLWAEKV